MCVHSIFVYVCLVCVIALYLCARLVYAQSVYVCLVCVRVCALCAYCVCLLCVLSVCVWALSVRT